MINEKNKKITITEEKFDEKMKKVLEEEMKDNDKIDNPLASVTVSMLNVIILGKLRKELFGDDK